jgi:hypothetical protein
MGNLVVLIDRKNWPADMRQAFNAELSVHAVATVLSVLVFWSVAAIAAGPFQTPLASGFGVLILVLIPVLQMLIRVWVRSPIRARFGLQPDRTPFWFNIGYFHATPDLARETLNDWQLHENRTYLPGIGFAYGMAWSMILSGLALAFLLPGLWFGSLAFGVVFIGLYTLVPALRASVIRHYTLDKDGQPFVL